MSYLFLRFYALKGQQIVAQGSTLGFWASREIVRAMTFRKVKFIFRTKMMVSYFPKMKFCNSVRRVLFALFIEFPRTVFPLHSFPRATFRFVPPETLPWAELFWPFRPGLVYKE